MAAGKPSLMELKRQQWAREREEAKTDWCPWGRPGCGAPLKWHRSSARSESRLTPVETKKNINNYLPPLNWPTHQQQQQHEPVIQMPATAPPPPPRRSQRHISHTDGETSGYHSDNHLIDPAAANYHQHRRSPSSRGRVEPLPPDTSSVILDHQGGPDVVSARADYKFLERKKWVQDGTVPHDLYPEIYDRSTTPRWVARPMNAFVQTEPHSSDQTSGDGSGDGHNGFETQYQSINPTPSFLRGQNAVLDVVELAERERKRAKANELQRVLLQQLAEKESKKQLERKKQEEEERRQEDEFRRHLEAEKRQIEEERRRLQDKKEAEERRLEAVKEAIAGAQQNALAEKMARRKTMQSRSAMDTDVAIPIHQADRATPAQHQQTCQDIAARQFFLSPRPPPTRSSLVDVEVQTEQQNLQPGCRCDKKSRTHPSRRSEERIATEESGAERPITQMSMIGLKSQTSNSTANRPLWGAHKSKAKYQSQTEKDPRFLQRRRERLRRRQKLLLEKQLHGSWPSSENSGSQEEVGDIFFPFLPGSGAGAPHEKYYEALQAAAVNRYYKKVPPANNHYGHTKLSNNHSDGELIQPGLIPNAPVAPVRSQPRNVSSPPVPALLKKIQINTGDSEKHEWENFSSQEHDAKIDKDFENLQIRQQRAVTEQDKQDLLVRLSLLKQNLEFKKAALDRVSLASSH